MAEVTVTVTIEATFDVPNELLTEDMLKFPPTFDSNFLDFCQDRWVQETGLPEVAAQNGEIDIAISLAG